MHEVVDAPLRETATALPSSLSGTLNESLLKSEVDDEQTTPTLALASSPATDSTVAPPPVAQTQLITVPIVSAQPVLTSTPLTTVKRSKRGLRSYLNSKKVARSSAVPAKVLVRPSAVPTPTMIPYTQSPVVISNPITPIIPKPVTSVQTNSTSGFTTYLVVDGTQGQLIQVANDGQQPVTFRNQIGQVLQATPITVVGSTNQPTITSIPHNNDCTLLSNSSQALTMVRTNSSIDIQQQTVLTNAITPMTTQQLTDVNHHPAPIATTGIINGNGIQPKETNSLLDKSKITNSNLSLSLKEIAQKINRHRRFKNLSLSMRKRGRPRLYERDPFTNKPIKNDATSEPNETTKPILTNTTLLAHGQITTFNALPNHSNSSNPLIYPNSTSSISLTNPSLLQQHQYSYPSLLNGGTSTNIITSPAYNSLINNTNSALPTSTFAYLSAPVTKDHPQSIPTAVTPISNFEISRTNSQLSEMVQPQSSPNNDVAVHYLGGFVIRESSHSFVSNHKEQMQCAICQKLDFSHKFLDQEKRLCSKLCSLKSLETKVFTVNESIRTFENVNLPQPCTSNMNESTSLPHDYGLPVDPSKWTVCQVGQFISRLTNETIRQAFVESEIDGQALLLITQEHLRDTMKIKLGPSLVISSEITKLCERAKTFSS